MYVSISLHHLAYLQALYDYSVELGSELTLLGGARLRDEHPHIERLVVPQQEGSAYRVEVIGPPTWLDALEGLALVWVHTHPGMSKFWSGTDDDTKDLLAAPPKVEIETAFAVSVVVGKDGMKCHVAVYAPIPYEVDDVPLVVMATPEQTKGALAKLRNDFKGKYQKTAWYDWRGKRGAASQYGDYGKKGGKPWYMSDPYEKGGLP